MKLLKKLEKNISCWFLIIISSLFFLLRFPSLFEPDWYGDEGIYQVLGMGINAGRLLYRDIFDNKPPLLYLLYSFVNSDLFAIRLLSLIFGLVTIWGFFLLSKKILSSLKSSFIATGFFTVLFGLPLIEGNIANAENFMLLPNIFAGILILKASEKNVPSHKLILIGLSGFILGISFLFKIVAVFDFAAFFTFLVFTTFPQKILNIFNKNYILDELKKLSIFTISFLLPIFLTTLFFILNGSLSYFLKAVLFNNVGYVGYGNTLIIPQGFLILKILLLLFSTSFIFLKRNLFEKGFIFASLWLIFSIFNAFFSQRPYTHYVLVLLPAFCLMIGLFTTNNKFSKLAGVLTLSTFIIILLNFHFYTKTVYYYQNFISFAVGFKSTPNYQKFFDGSTPRDYEIANYILLRAKPESNIFIWGNNAPVYSLINKLPPGRYSVAYHITSYKDGLENTKEGLKKQQPQFIIIMPNVPSYPFSLSSYNLKINLKGVNIYEKFNR